LISSPKLSICFKACIAIIGIVGLLLQIGVLGGKYSPELFRMFTVQSNLLVVLYNLGAVFFFLRHPDQKAFLNPIKFIAMISIILTGLVSAIMLGSMLSEAQGTMRVSLIILHIIIPIGVLLDWILFDEKGRFTRAMALYGLIFPLSYTLFIFTTAPFLEAGERTIRGIVLNYRYPYPFLQVDRYGWVTVILCVIGLAVLLYILGYLFYRVDRSLGSHKHSA